MKDKVRSAQARKERLLNHIVSMHGEIITALRAAGLDPDDATMKGLIRMHHRTPHPPPLGKENLS